MGCGQRTTPRQGDVVGEVADVGAADAVPQRLGRAQRHRRRRLRGVVLPDRLAEARVGAVQVRALRVHPQLERARVQLHEHGLRRVADVDWDIVSFGIPRSRLPQDVPTLCIVRNVRPVRQRERHGALLKVLRVGRVDDGHVDAALVRRRVLLRLAASKT